jgi:hypothetical protein
LLELLLEGCYTSVTRRDGRLRDEAGVVKYEIKDSGIRSEVNIVELLEPDCRELIFVLNLRVKVVGWRHPGTHERNSGLEQARRHVRA